MRLNRLSFAAGFAAGYVAGTRAGREKYDQMVKFARNVAENPKVQQAATQVQGQANELISTATQMISGSLQERVPKVAQTARDKVGDHIPGLRHRNGHRSAGEGETGSGDGRPFAATSSGGTSGQPEAKD